MKEKNCNGDPVSRVLRSEDVRRAQVILMLDAGESYLRIQRAVGCDARYVSRWKTRFQQEGLAGLYSRHCGRAVSQGAPPGWRARILDWDQAPTTGRSDALE